MGANTDVAPVCRPGGVTAGDGGPDGLNSGPYSDTGADAGVGADVGDGASQPASTTQTRRRHPKNFFMYVWLSFGVCGRGIRQLWDSALCRGTCQDEGSADYTSLPASGGSYQMYLWIPAQGRNDGNNTVPMRLPYVKVRRCCHFRGALLYLRSHSPTSYCFSLDMPLVTSRARRGIWKP